MQNRPSHPSRKPLILLLLVLCCIVFLAVGTYANYTYSISGSVKRVISAQTVEEAAQLRFSSNYLTVGGSGDNKGFRVISVPAGEGAISIAITVCNYPQSDSSQINSEDITYQISYKVYDTNNTEKANSGVTMSNSEPNSPIPLKGGKPSYTLHTLTIPRGELSNINYIEVTATPSEPEALHSSPLSAKLKITTAAGQSVGWEGHITDDVTGELDAINYQISGTQAGTLTITWESSVVTLSKWSAEMLGVTEQPVTNSITVQVGGENAATSYLLQFYWTNGVKTPAEANIRCSFP